MVHLHFQHGFKPVQNRPVSFVTPNVGEITERIVFEAGKCGNFKTDEKKLEEREVRDGNMERQSFEIQKESN